MGSQSVFELMPDVPHSPGAPPRATSAQPAPAKGGGGIDLTTLLITAAASAAAAYVTSKVWAPGTLASAAFTPVIVAILKEAFRKPTEVVVRATPVRGMPRRTRRQQLPEDLPERFAEGAPVPAPPPLPGAPEGVVQYRSRPSGHRWRLALVTGLLGFLICALIFTISEIVAGRSASGGGRSTTLFGGDERERDKDDTDTRTTTIRERTVTIPPPRTVTVPPPETVTVPPVTVTTPTTTTTPGETTTTPPEP